MCNSPSKNLHADFCFLEILHAEFRKIIANDVLHAEFPISVKTPNDFIMKFRQNRRFCMRNVANRNSACRIFGNGNSACLVFANRFERMFGIFGSVCVSETLRRPHFCPCSNQLGATCKCTQHLYETIAPRFGSRISMETTYT
jgi:hypothetical protein